MPPIYIDFQQHSFIASVCCVLTHSIHVSLLYFREFFYIQMEKYARQALQEGVKDERELLVNDDHELYRVLNVHYNRNNHIEVCFIIHSFILKKYYKEYSNWIIILFTLCLYSIKIIHFLLLRNDFTFFQNFINMKQ